MPAVALPPSWSKRAGKNAGRLELTLLELIWAIQEVTEDEREVVATVVELLESGRVHLRGNFRGHRRLIV